MNRPPSAEHKSKRLFARALIVVLIIVTVAAGIHRLREHADMSVTPSIYSECTGPAIVAHLKWDMRGTAKGHVFMSAYQLGMPPKTFASGPLVGEMNTGHWAADGTTIMLTDDRNRVLGKRTIESTDCPAHPLWVH